MPRRVKALENPVTIELDGDTLEAREGESVASAVWAAGQTVFSRSPKYHRPRGPYCFSGGCSHCLMRVDGVPNVATCCVPVKPGLRLERQNALPDARVDLLRANDFVFSDWFNHHEFLAGVPFAEAVLLKVARQLSGLGLLPDSTAPAREPARVERHALVIVGAGAAGLAVAQRLHERGVEALLLEREAYVGGRLLCAAEEAQPAPWQPPPDKVRTRARVVGLFADDGAPFLAVISGQRLHLLFFERLVLTVGGNASLPTFPNNDLPGVMAGRAVATLLRRDGILPGDRIACVGDGAEARALAALISQAGGEAVAVGARVLRAHGLKRVTAATVEPGGKVACDVIAVCAPPSPAFELAKAGGATVAWSEAARTFVVEADAQGRTANPRLFVAGELRGPMSSAAAAAQGLVVADALASGGAP